MSDPNLPLLEDAVRNLAPFLDEIVFVGGVTLGLLITDEAPAPIRGTTDVDVIAEIVTYADYIAFSDRLREARFTEDTDLTCRWHNGTLTLDVLALCKDVLGFTNVWYESALCYSSTVNLSRRKAIRVIAAPFFLGTKMAAFRARGRMDFQVSHDLEDFVAVIEGRDMQLGQLLPPRLMKSMSTSCAPILNERVIAEYQTDRSLVWKRAKPGVQHLALHLPRGGLPDCAGLLNVLICDRDDDLALRAPGFDIS